MEREEAAAKDFFENANIDIQFTRGHKYVGSVVGWDVMQQKWFQPQIQQWVDAVEMLASFAKNYPQSAYAGLLYSLQAEWIYLSRTTPTSPTLYGQ